LARLLDARQEAAWCTEEKEAAITVRFAHPELRAELELVPYHTRTSRTPATRAHGRRGPPLRTSAMPCRSGRRCSSS
jgi:hypothetical protein